MYLTVDLLTLHPGTPDSFGKMFVLPTLAFGYDLFYMLIVGNDGSEGDIGKINSIIVRRLIW